jgi:hypothetical protein
LVNGQRSASRRSALKQPQSRIGFRDVDDAKYLSKWPAGGFVGPPASNCFSDRIEKGHNAASVSTNHCVLGDDLNIRSMVCTPSLFGRNRLTNIPAMRSRFFCAKEARHQTSLDPFDDEKPVE